MNFKYAFSLFIAVFYTQILFSQTTPRILEAKRTEKFVIIDGKLDEAAWNDAAKADDFTEFRPKVGRKDSLGNQTETYIMYSNEGIYFGGTCYESDISQISKELVGRDGFGANDYIGLIFDTYNDKLNGFEYFVTPLGEQWDAKMTANQNSNNGGEDFDWNAVWKSSVQIHEKGWTFEMFIPFSAIRFSKDKIQDWGINITRRRRKSERQNCWNPINPTVNGFLTQEGTWKGLTNIKPPVRLQFFPYFSTYANHYPANNSEIKDWTGQISGGLDLKLGISQSFTLDATLIPDFGQVQSDNKVLNLTPFEVKYNEYRTFFTEGTELFNKGNLFYSRRIGGTPIHLNDAYNAANDKEKITNNPTISKLINATKISGRTSNGLGVGLLNAVTRSQFATIEHTETGEIRHFQTDPATNYTIFVLDQTFKHNSSISFVHTSVLRGSNDYNANVSAGLFSFFDKKNTYQISGSGYLSKLNFKVPDKENSMGYSHTLSFAKNSGKLSFNLTQDQTDSKFTSNDLGYFTNNNFLNHSLYVGYRINTPKYWYNRINFNFFSSISYLNSPIADIDTKYQNSRINLNVNTQTKKIRFFGVYGNFQPVQNDFYEPRTTGYNFKRGGSFGMGGWYGTNNAKKYSIYFEYSKRTFMNFYGLNSAQYIFNQQFRFNSKFSIRHSMDFDYRPRALGFTTILDDNSIILALRKVKAIDNTLTLKYNFTNKMGLNFRARHYLSTVKNRSYFKLQKDGTLVSKSELPDTYHRNVNYFNIDMVYTWQFAPGSFLNVVWKAAAATSSNLADRPYFDNLQNTLDSDQNNNFSVKVIYFIDYLNLKRKR